MKHHVRAHRKNPFPVRAQMNQADAGDDLVRPALQPRQHSFRIGGAYGLAHDFAGEKHQRVRAEHERVGIFFCHRARLATGIELANFKRRKLLIQNLRRVAGNDSKIQFQLPQQFRASRRGRGENERRQIHAANLSNVG